jgi:hypothetical protein
MKNAIVLESHNEILSAHMRGEYPELALVIPTKEAEPSEITDISAKYEIGKYYPNKGIYAGELKKQDGFYGIFAALQDAGEKDDDGDSQEYTWEEAMKIKFSQDNIHVPDIRELSLLHLNIDDVNAGLSAAGGEKLESYYWSCTGYSSNSAWYLWMDVGLRDYARKNLSKYVRPVLALKL